MYHRYVTISMSRSNILLSPGHADPAGYVIHKFEKCYAFYDGNFKKNARLNMFWSTFS